MGLEEVGACYSTAVEANSSPAGSIDLVQMKALGTS